ncbi:MAG: hypothetical protein DGJ47_000095 [Rickettsiaceae bacterium]
MSNTEEKVIKIVQESLGCEEGKVTKEARIIEDLGADSLDTVEIMMAVEEEFGVTVPDEEAEKIVTVQGIIDAAEEHLKK